MTTNAGFVSVGITSDTGRVRRAVDPLLARAHGTPRCPHARELTITAGLRRLEWRAGAAVEGRTAKARRRDRPRDPRPPLSVAVNRDLHPAPNI
jgi:hypothetical protein